MNRFAILFAGLFLLATGIATGGNQSAWSKGKPQNIVCPSCPRDKNGLVRRGEPKRQFMKRTGYPKGRKSYVIDYIIPLEKGGMNDPANMQWLTKAEAKAKHQREHERRRGR